MKKSLIDLTGKRYLFLVNGEALRFTNGKVQTEGLQTALKEVFNRNYGDLAIGKYPMRDELIQVAKENNVPESDVENLDFTAFEFYIKELVFVVINEDGKFLCYDEGNNVSEFKKLGAFNIGTPETTDLATFATVDPYPTWQCVKDQIDSYQVFGNLDPYKGLTIDYQKITYARLEIKEEVISGEIEKHLILCPF